MLGLALQAAQPVALAGGDVLVELQLAAGAAAPATVWPGSAAAPHRPGLAVTAAGFVIDELDRVRFLYSPLASPAAPHILGTARRA